MRTRPRPLAAPLLLAALWLAPVAAQPSVPLIVRLGAAVDAWEQDLGSIVADERYAQTVVRLPRSGATRGSNRPPREERRLESELTLVHFDHPSAWIGFRHVRRIDGREPEARPTPAQVLDDGALSWDERWRRVLDLSASFNIGSVARDVNLPTFALAALRSANQARFRFSSPRSDRLNGEAVQVIGFRETGRPTLVGGLRGRDVPLQGQVWFTGDLRVRRTEILLRDRVAPANGGREEDRVREEELTSRITVTFGPDPNVAAWVPLEMRERYEDSWGETTTGAATYTNYRRFRTSGRLVRPGAPYGAFAP